MMRSSQVAADELADVEEPSPAKAWLQRAAALVVVALFALILFRERSALASLATISPGHVAWILAGTLGAWTSSVMSTRLLLELQGAQPQRRELWMLHVASGLLNHLPLRAGLALRALYYRRRTRLEWSAVAGVVALQTLLQIAAGGLTAAVASLVIGQRPLALLFAAIGLAPALLFVVPWSSITPLRRVGPELAKLRNDRRRWIWLMVLGAVSSACAALRLWAAFDAIEAPVAFAEAWIVALSAPLTLLLALTPAGLGVTEFLTVGLGAMLAVAPNDGLVAATLVRLVVTACFLVAGLPALVALKARLRRER